MKLNDRERQILVVTVVAVGLFLAYQFVLTPFLATRADLVTQNEKAQERLKAADKLFTDKQIATRRWSQMTKAGLQFDPSVAKSTLVHSVNDWAQTAGLSLQILKQERDEQDKQFRHLGLRATGTGNLAAISSFLWQIQSAKVPARITDLLIETSRKEGSEDLSLSCGISTIVLLPDAKPAQSQAPAPPKETP